MSPLGRNVTDLNSTGISYRNGTPVTLPLDVGNEVTWNQDPAHFGNPVPTSGTEQNVVNWSPTPTHFGNEIGNFAPMPTFGSVSPSSGSTAGGTSVTVTGTGFVSGAEVTFGGNLATSIVVVDSEHITCVTPAGTSGPADVVVTTSGGTATGHDAWTYVTSSGLIAHIGAAGDGTFSGVTTTGPIDTTGADFLVVIVSAYAAFAGATVTDSLGNSWLQVPALNQTFGTPAMYYVSGATVGPGQTFTASLGGADLSLVVMAFAGVQTSGSLQAWGTHTVVFSPTTTTQPGSVTPANAGDLIVSGLGGIVVPTSPSIDSGFSLLDKEGTSNEFVMSAYLFAPNTSPVNPTWGVASNPNRMQAGIAVFSKA
jgi:hypothetical protein